MFGIFIDRTLKLPIIRQIYQQIRKRILDGSLQAGDRLPSTRDLANDLKVSRNVVIEAYELLFTEGFITSSQGKGTFVAEGARLDFSQTNFNVTSAYLNKFNSQSNETIIDFKPGVPDLNIFPRSKWVRYYSDVVKHCPDNYLGYQNPEGAIELRRALVNFLYRTRGLQCAEDQIIITSGAAQGLSIISKLLFSSDKTMCIEDPCSNDIYRIFSNQDYKLKSIEVDEFGIKTNKLLIYKNTSLIYVTPSHQFPIGGMLPIQRRIELIKYARKNNSYIIEDDYDSEFRYSASPISSLFELDPNYVIYLGTFSKNLLPALRMGYMILPRPLIEKCKQLKWYMDLHSPSLAQIALAKFIDKGELEVHIRKGKKIYKRKQQKLITKLKNMFPDIKLFGTSTGLHLTVEFPTIKYEDNLIQKLKNESVMIYPVKKYIKDTKIHQDKWILGFGHLSIEEIQEGVERISKALNRTAKS